MARRPPLTLALAPVAQAASARLVYSGDWSGSPEIHSVAPATGSIAQVTFGHEPSCDPLVVVCGFTDVVPSPDGRHIAFEGENEDLCNARIPLFVARPDGSAARQIADRPSFGCPTFTWSPDSRRLAYVVNPYLSPVVYVVDANGSDNRRLGYGEDPTWSPRGHMIAELDNHELYVNPGGHWWLPAPSVDEYAWSPNRKWIAIITRDPESRLELVRPDRSETRQLANEPAEKPSWSSDGRFIAYGDAQGVEVADLESRTTRLVDDQGRLEHAWSFHGDLIAFEGHDGLSVFDARTGKKSVLTSEHGSQVAWAPDDHLVAMASATFEP